MPWWLSISDGESRAPASPGAPDSGASPIEWTFNPWRERPGAAALASVGALGLCLLVTSLSESWVLTLGLCLAAVGALSPLIAPARCRVDEHGVARRGALGWNRLGWDRIRRGSFARGGLLVSPYASKHWLDATRGLFLPIPARARAGLLARIGPRLVDRGL